MGKIEQIRRDSIRRYINANNNIINRRKIYGYKFTKNKELYFKRYREDGYYYEFIGILDYIFAPSGNFKGI